MINYPHTFFFFFFHSFPNFRCWCHHSCRHLLIWHGCFGGESYYIDRMAWDLSLSNTCVMVCDGVCRWRSWKSMGMESPLMFLRRPSTMPYSHWRTPCRGWDEDSEVYVQMLISFSIDQHELGFVCDFVLFYVCKVFFPKAWYMFVFVGVNPEMPGIWSQ